jgi:hypothetical protein
MNVREWDVFKVNANGAAKCEVAHMLVKNPPFCIYGFAVALRQPGCYSLFDTQIAALFIVVVSPKFAVRVARV